MGDWIEVRRGVYPPVAQYLDGSLDDRESWSSRYRDANAPVGTAYAVWVGVGAVGTVLLGIALFAEPVNPGRLVSVGLIIAGIVGLKLSSPA